MDAKYNSTLRDEAWIKNRLSELSNQASAAQNALENQKKGIAGSAGNIELRDFVAAAESSTTALDNFRHTLRQMEAARQQSLPVFEARLVTEALPPLRAGSPKGAIVLGISTIAGMLLGAAIGLLRDLSTRGIHTSRQVLRELQIPCIAVVPRITPNGIWRKLAAVFSSAAEKKTRKLASLESPVSSMRSGPVSIARPSPHGERIAMRSSSNLTSADCPASRTIVRTEGPIWTITDAPQSQFTEAFLKIKLAIDNINRSGKRNQVIGITSTQPNEGKSTVAAALALLMAHAGARVILVDCNLRNRSLSATLAPTAAFGILDITTGAVSLSETTWTDSLSELAFLPAGNNSRSIYASAVLTSENLQKLFQTLRETYAYVIIDLPAVVPFADVRAAAHLLDSFILVVESGRSNTAAIERAIEACSDMDEIMLGVTLNKDDQRYE
jgi:succinoglycan biosynthesis transport protein ExoP